MKFAGIVLIVLAGSGLGLYYSRRLHRRVALLKSLERLLEAVEQRLRYTCRPLSALFKELAAGEIYGELPLAAEVAAAPEGGTFADAFTRAVRRLAAGGMLLPEETALLTTFGEGCGRSGREEQLNLVRACREQLCAARERAQEKATTYGRLYAVMGISGGAALALMMI